MMRFFIVLAACICLVSANSFASVFDDMFSKEKEKQKKYKDIDDKEFDKEYEKFKSEIEKHKAKKIIYNGHKLTYENLLPAYELGEKLIRKSACLSYFAKKYDEKDMSYFKELSDSITPISGANAGEMLIRYYQIYAGGGWGSGSYLRQILDVCQKVSGSIGINGLDCSTCSGTWQYKNYQFQSADGKIIRVIYTNESGIVIDFSESVLSVFFPQVGYKVIYAIEGWEAEKTVRQNDIKKASESFSNWIDYMRKKTLIDASEKGFVEFSVVEVSSPSVVNEVKRYLNADAQISNSVTYSIINEIFQKEMEAGGRDAIQFAISIINPKELAYRLNEYFKEKGAKK